MSKRKKALRAVHQDETLDLPTAYSPELERERERERELELELGTPMDSEVDPIADDPVGSALDHFVAEAVITEVLYQVKSGKEATVYCCRAHPQSGEELLAAKIYRAREHRGFHHDAIYQEGRYTGKGRESRALRKKTQKGRELQFSMWVDHEYETLTALSRVGADVPTPLARSESVIIMQYFGDEAAAAPPLERCQLSPTEARAVFDSLFSNVELWLAHNYVHGDLSAYNVLYWNGKATIIDFPQAVDPRFNRNAAVLLQRDIDNLCRAARRHGLRYDGERIADRLWRRFRDAELSAEFWTG